MTGTLGKAMGARAEGIPLPTRRSSRCCGSVPAVSLLQLPGAFYRGCGHRHAGSARDIGELLQRLRENTAYFRSEMTARHFEIPESDHPIVPIMIGDAVEAAAMADRLLTRESTFARSPTQSYRVARRNQNPDVCRTLPRGS